MMALAIDRLCADLCKCIVPLLSIVTHRGHAHYVIASHDSKRSFIVRRVQFLVFKQTSVLLSGLSAAVSGCKPGRARMAELLHRSMLDDGLQRCSVLMRIDLRFDAVVT